jgi:hypothetical protein
MLEGAIQGAAGGGSVVNRMRQCLPELDSKEQEVDDQCYGGYEGDIDTTGNAIRCNTQQAGEEKAAYIWGICKPEQTPATPYLSLVMSRPGVRVPSSALFSSLYLQLKPGGQ